MSLLAGLDLDAFHETLRNARQRLLAERNEHGWWTGELSSSALSTATAVVALTLAARNGCDAAQHTRVQPLIDRGIRWLIQKQNADGGWGDTDKSKSNVSTTMLVWAAMGLGAKGPNTREARGAYDAVATRACDAGGRGSCRAADDGGHPGSSAVRQEPHPPAADSQTL